MSLQRYVSSCILLIVSTSAIPLVKDTIIGSLNKRFRREDGSSMAYRLSEAVIPTKYTIRLELDMASGNFKFNGETDIEIQVRQQTSTIILHAKKLIFESKYTKLLRADGSRVKVRISSYYDRGLEIYKLILNGGYLPIGSYLLKLKYTGSINNEKKGLYRSSYTNSRGEKVWFALTQFEPTYARWAFPCFDEPSFKATFKIIIKHSSKHTAVSNMPAMSTKIPYDQSICITEFGETQKMSTYLVAFVVSDFKLLTNDDGSFRVFANANKIHLGRFAQSTGPALLGELEDYTKIDYKLPKIDNFAIPSFSNYGMENWGLVTFREEVLLYDEKHTTTQSKQEIVRLMSHEYAHQWFGNLVTPSWWSYIWLNEGFARYFEWWITDRVESSWRMMEQFVTEELQKEAFVADDKESQHAMDFTANKVLEPRKVFDEITYDKSACVIRMFSHVLTPTVFQSGLQNYLMHKSYDTVTSADLIRELVTVAGKDIEFLDKALLSWITRPGYPVVTVMRNHSAGTAAISQKRFLTNPLAVRTGKWFVPINVVSEEEPNRFSDTKPTHWLLDDAQSLRLSGLKNDKWIILNSQQTGYYRVNYDAENWKLIIDYLQNPNSMKNIHVLNRAQLLDDSFHLAAAVELPNYSVFFNMTKYLQHEEDLIPWCAAHRALAFLNKVLANSKCYDLFKLYVQRLTANLEEKLGYTENANEDYDAKMSRLNLVRLACAVGSAKCLAATHKMLLEHVGGIKKISVDLQSVVLCAGMRSASRQQWEMVYNYTTKLPEDTDEHSISFAALGCHSDPVVLEMYLEKALITASDSIRNYVAKALYNGDMPGVDIDVFFDFMEDHLETIYKRSFLENGTNLIFIHSIEIASRMTTREQIKRLQHLIAELRRHYHLLAVYVHDHAEAKADGNVRWVENHETDVTTFLAAQHLITE